MYLEKCNVGKREQKRDSLSLSFLTVGNDGNWEMMISSLTPSKQSFVIPEQSRTRYQESAFDREVSQMLGFLLWSKDILRDLTCGTCAKGGVLCGLITK